jgi:hypothetical protein
MKQNQMILLVVLIPKKRYCMVEGGNRREQPQIMAPNSGFELT